MVVLSAVAHAAVTVTGNVYNDSNKNNVLDPGEPGLGVATWVKLVSGGVAIQAAPADIDTGAYTLTNVANGSYTILVDDNATLGDTIATAPTNWFFQNPATGSSAITVSGAALTGQNFGLYYTSTCVCGYANGRYTLTTITPDGNMADWAAVLADADNNSCDAADATDRDAPVQSTGRNLIRTAVTWDANYFYMYTARSGSSTNTQNFIYYNDSNNDGLVSTGERVVVAGWHGSNQTVDLALYSYIAAAPGGDPLVDANGYADGYKMPGILTKIKDLPAGSGSGDVTGSQMEWRISWTDLGVASGSAIRWHSSTTNSNPSSTNLPSQIDDDMGGCGGQCPGNNQFAGVQVSAPAPVTPAPTMYLPHTVTNTGNGGDTFKLTSTSSGPWTPASITYYKDVGVIGVFEPGMDTLLTDTDADGFPDTGMIAAGASFNMFVAVQTPGAPALGSDNIVTTFTSSHSHLCGGGPLVFTTTTDVATAPAADLAITKTDGVTSAVPGTSLTYTIKVTNNGPDSETGAAVADTFAPAIFNVAGVSWTCALTAGTGSCGAASGTGNLSTTVNLDSGAVATYTATAPILPNATGTISNTATVTAPATVTDSIPGNNSATDNNTVLAGQSDLQITKTDGRTSAVPGTNLSYTITVTNAGPSTATGAAVADTLSATWFNVSGASWTCAITAGAGSCGAASGTGNLSSTVTLQPSATATYTITAPILSGATGTIANTATVSAPSGSTDPNPANNSATDANTVLAPSADLSITKTDGVASYVAGGTVTYTIVVSNAGPSNALGATVTDTIAALAQVASDSWTCAGTGGATCTGGPVSGNINDTVNVPVGGTVTYTLTARLYANATGNLVNSASVAVAAGTTDPGPGQNTATDTDTASRSADLTITKTDGVATYVAGTSVTYTIDVTNPGPSDVVGATVTDPVLSAAQVASAVWTCVAAGGATCTAGPVAGNLNDTINIPVGGEATYTLTATLRSNAAGSLSNTASIAPPAGTTDPGPGANSATDTDAAGARVSDLAITKTDGVSTYTPGGTVSYTIVVSNAGPADALGATVTDSVLSLPQVASASWTCVGAGGATCTAGPVAGNINDTVNVPVGGTATYTLMATLKSSAVGNLVNQASVSGAPGTTDPGPGPNGATDTDTESRVADLSVTKTDGSATYLAGGTAIYTIVVSNAGPSDAVGAAVTDAILSLPQVASASWTCAASGGAACTAGPVAGNISDTVNIPAGASVTYTLSAVLKSSATGSLANTASVTAPAGTTDPGPGANSAVDTDTPAARVSDLAITKSDGVASYTAGGSVTYTIVVSNAGPSDAIGATVSDAVTSLPQVASASWTCVGAGGATCTAGPVAGNIADTVNIPVGGTATYTLVASLRSSAAGSLANTATVTAAAGTSDPGAANNSAVDTDTEVRVADLTITKTDGVATYLAGGTTTYTIVVGNAGPSDAIGATVTDAVTSLPQVASASWTCVGAGGATCAAGPVAGNIADTVNVPVGGTATYTVAVQLRANATGNLANTATVAPPAGTTDPGPGADTATDTDTPGSRVSDLSITKTDGVASYTAGGTVTYTIVVSNAGPSDAENATVTDTVLALPQVASASWTCVAAGGATCTAGPVAGNLNDTVDVPVGGTATFTLVVTLRSSATGNLVNTATVAVAAGSSDPGPGANSATDTDTPGPHVSDLAIAKSDSVTSYIAGGSLTYTIVVTNAGPSDAIGATVADNLLALPQVASASWTCVGAGGATCTAGPVSGNIADTVDVPVGGSATYTVIVAVKASATGDIANTATVTGAPGTSDPGPGSNTATDTDTPASRVSDMAITKTDGVASYLAGGTVTYTIVVTNGGPSDAVGAKISDPVLASPQVASASWTCVAAGGAACTAGPVSGDVNDTIDVPVGSTATYTVVVALKSGASGNLVNTATLTPPPGTGDPTGGDNTATDTDTPAARISDLSITKTDGVASYLAGGSTTYTIVVSNVGPSDAIGATVSDAVLGLPQVASATWSCVGAGGATCAAVPSSGNVNDTIDVPVGGTATYTVLVGLKPGATGNLVNTATVVPPAGTSDPGPGPDSATDTDTPGARVTDLSITKTDGVATYLAGGSVTYTIVVSNAGPSDAIGAKVTDAIATLPQVASASWTCVAAGGATCAAGPISGNINDTVDLPVGGTATYTLTATLRSGASGNLVNTAAVAPAAGTTDPGPGPDSATDTDTPAARVSDLAITKTDGAATYLAGGTTTYTIVVSNAGPSDAAGATVTDPVLSLPQVASASWTCTAAGGATCTAGPVAGNINDTVSIPVGGTATYAVTVNLKSGATGSLVNTATVTPPAGSSDPGPGANSATDTDAPGAHVSDLSITKSDGTATYLAGGTTTYTIVVANAGPSDAIGAKVTDAPTALPQVASATWSCAPAGGATCAAGLNAGDINDTVNIPVGGTATYTVTVALKSGATGDLVNTAAVAPAAGTTDPGPGPDSATDTDTPAARVSDLAITKTDGAVTYLAGGSVTYTVVVTNAGPSDAVGATVTDPVAALPQVASASWTCVAAGGASCTAGPVAGSVSDTVNVPVGGTLTYTIHATLRSSATGDLVNTATVAPPAGSSDPGPGPNAATDTDTPGARISDLSITKSDGVATYLPGGTVTYTIVVSNAGPSDAVGAVVSDAVAALPQVASASWTCVAAGGATCTAGPVSGNLSDTINVPVGGTATYTVVANLKSGATGNLVNTASVDPPAGTSDPAPAGNDATDTDAKGVSVSDLTVTKTDGATTYLAGGTTTYTIVVTNAGPSDAIGASVTDAVTALPQVASATWTCAGTGGATCTSGFVTGNIADTVNVPVGGKLTYTLVVTLKSGATGKLVNAATVAVAAGSSDPGPGPDTATDIDTPAARVSDLAITKSDGVLSYLAGGSGTYTIVVSNAGPSDAVGATVTDAVLALPQVNGASWTCAAAGGATCTAGPVAGNLNDTVNVPVGGTATYTLTVALKSGASGDLVNTATVAPAAGTTDPAAANDSATDTDTPASRVSDLSITKSDGAATYLAGGTVTYTIVVSNAGPSDAIGAVVTDPIATLPQIASASWTCVGAGGATCTAGPASGSINDTVNVPVGGTATYTVVATIRSSATGNLANTATVTPPAGTADPNPAGDNATDTDTPAARVTDLAITKSDGVASYVAGGTVTYTIVVTNAGPSDAIGARVDDAVTGLPQVAGASWTCVGAGGATCAAGPVAGNIADTVNVPVGGSATYTLVTSLRSSASGNLVNTATVAAGPGASDPAAANDTATDTDTAAPRVSDLSITKSDGTATYVAGGTVTYTLVVANAGPSDAIGATVTDAVTALPQVASASWTCVGAGGATCAAGPVAGNVSDTVNVPVGGTATYTVTVTLRSNAVGNLVNTASVAAPAGTTDPGPGANSATDTDTPGPRVSDLSITKTDGVPSYTPGGTVTYTIVVANAGPSDAVGATVTDAVAALPQVASAHWTCVGAGGATCAAGPVTGDINDTVNVPVGGTATYTLVVTLRPGAAGDLVNTATVAPPAGSTDPGPGANSATDTDTAGARVTDLTITKTDGVPSYLAGGTVTYTIVVGNAGPSDAVGAIVGDAVLALPQVASASWTCVGAGGASCTAGPVAGNIADTANIPVGGTATYTLVATLRSNASGNLVNTATVAPAAGSSDPGPGANTATDTDTPGSRVSDLSITKTDGVATYTAGGTVTYTIVVANAGPSDAAGAVVADAVLALPQVASASWTCVGASGATCTPGPVAGNLNDTVNVPVGGTATYTMSVALRPGAAGNLVNTATVTPPAGTADPGPGANSATDTDTEVRVADLSISKTDGVTSYVAGGTVTYTIVVSNAGPSDAVGASVTDPITSLAQVASAHWTCVAAGGATCAAGPVTGNIADTANIPVGATATYTLVAALKSGATGDLVNTASVAPPAGTSDPAPGGNTATDTDTAAARVSDLSITKTDGLTAYPPGGSVTYTIVVGNAGPSDAVGATVADAVAGLTQVASASWTCAAAGGATCTAGPVSGNIADTINVPVGGTATYTLTATLRSNASGNLVNTATVAPAAGSSDPAAGNDSATDTDTPGARVSDLSITKTDGVVAVVAGQSLTYTIRVGNAGPAEAIGAAVTDTLDPTWLNAAAATWTCAITTPPGSCGAASGTGNLNTTVTLDVGGVATYTVTVPVLVTATGTIVNTAIVSSAPGGSDPNAANNAGTDNDTQINPFVDLSLTKTVSNPTPNVGTNVVFTVTVTDAAGFRPAGGVVVKDRLPNGYVYVSDDGGGSYVPATGIWTVGAVIPGTPRVLQITARVLPTGTYLNAAEVTAADQPDINDTYGNGSGNDYGTATVSPRGTDATIDITDTSIPGDTLSVTVTDGDRNADPAAAETVTATVVNNATGETETITLTETGPNTGIFRGTIATVGGSTAGANGDGVLVTRAGDTVTASYQDTWTSTGTPATRTDTGTVTGAILRITKAVDQETATTGEAVSYTLRVENLTSAAQAGVTVSDLIPAGFKYVPESAHIIRAGADARLGTSDDVLAVLAATGVRPVDFGPFAMAPSEVVLIRYVLRIGSGVTQGEHQNRATPLLNGSVAGSPADASILIVADPTFDQSTIIGKVFEDLDRNGRLDPGEPGVPKAMVALDDGTYAITDDEGRYHFPAVTPGQRMVKINVHSLPPGSIVTTDDSDILSLTPGLMAKANFGVVLARHEAATADRQFPALSVASHEDVAPVDIQGSAESLAAIVNGTAVKLAAGDAHLRIEPLDDVVTLRGSGLEKPVRFDLSTDAQDGIASWSLSVADGRGQVVKTLDGDGAPPPKLAWDGTIDGGAQITAGEIYQYRLEIRGKDGGVYGSPVRLFGVNRVSTVSFQLSPDSFDTGRATLSPKAKLMLAEAAKTFREIPDEKIAIEGHTDNVGSDAFNLELSKRRAEAALRYLVDAEGLPESQFVVRWFGKGHPVASNVQPEGRTQNRRVEIKGAKDEVQGTRPSTPFRSEPSVKIDGAAVEVGPRGRFAAQVDDPTASRVTVDLSDSKGRTAKAVVPIPTITITEPPKEALFAREAPSGGCQVAAGGSAAALCGLRGHVDPGDALEIDGHAVEIAADGAFETPLALAIGDNTVGIVVRNPQGFARIANLDVRLEDRDAQGRMHVVTEPVPTLTINLPPQGTELKVQSLDLEGATDAGNELEIDGKTVAVGPDGRFSDLLELRPGKNHVVVKVKDGRGREGVIERDFVVVKNEIFLMALADGEFGRMQGKGQVEAAGLDKTDAYYTNGRVAYYLKGVIQGKYLITSAFDSGNTQSDSPFRGLDPEASRKLLTNLDPDKIYPVYGDSSTIVYDAESQGKFYLALDSDEIHAVFGNYPISLTDTELAAYRRTLYGARFAYQSVSKTSYGVPDTQAIVFGAENRNAHIHDELQATGGSLYYLSHHDVIEGSEDVSIVVRDVNTGLMLARQRQQRNIDYTVKYPEGRIVFNRPISSVVETTSLISPTILSGHPVYVEADYEAVTEGLDKTAEGARARQQVNDHVAVGATYVKDELDAGKHELAGVDTEVRLGKSTRLTGEYATSQGTDAISYVSSDGGITYTQAPTGTSQSGSAWKAAAEMDVGEWFGRPGLYHVRAYYKKLDPGFFASGNLLEQGTEKAGVNADLKIGEADVVQVHVDREDRSGPAPPNAPDQSLLGDVQWNHTAKRWGFAAEMQNTDNKDTSGNPITRNAFAAVKLWRKITEKVSGYLQHQQTVTGPANDQTTAGITYQVAKAVALDLKATDGSIGRSAQAGAIVRVGETDLYVTQRAAEDLAGRKNTTILGARSPLGPSTKIYGEYQWEDADAGARKTALVGMQRKWDIMRGFNFLFSGEAANVHSGTTDANRTAVSAAVTYAPNDRLTTVARTEGRWETTDKTRFQLFALLQVDYKIDNDFTLLGKYRVSRTKDRDTSVLEAQFDERSIGVAYRPVGNDRLNALARYTHLEELSPLSLAGAARTDRTMDVMSGEGIYDFGNGVEWFGKLAARRERKAFDFTLPIDTDSFLGITRVNVRVHRPIDLGIEYRILAERPTDDRRQGFLTELMWVLHKNFRVGGGYNFTDFSDNEFSSNDYSVRGWFLRAQVRY